MSKLILGGDKFYKVERDELLENAWRSVVPGTLNWESERIFSEIWMTKD